MENTAAVNGLQYAKMIQAGAANLRTQVKAINDLNVFPIPDGDTGDNMLLTMMGGADAAGEGSESLSETSRRVAGGMLLSARGNSGVILSQFFDGMAAGFEGLEQANSIQLCAALQRGVQHAYRAVLEPAEGTILTVARSAADYASRQGSQKPDEVLGCFLEEGRRTLDKTSEMLPVLKKAGVVDSGGAGLIYIVEGMEKALRGEDLLLPERTFASDGAQELDLDLFDENSVLEYGYCTELLLRLQTCKTDPSAFRIETVTDFLKTLGDSVVAFKNGTIVKLHVHTKTPDRVLAFCQQYGEFLKIKVENMSLQHNNNHPGEHGDELKLTVKPPREKKNYGVVAVCSGEGIAQMFSERGADVIVDGGQSSNPSTEDFLEAFRKTDAKTILVLPNNGNVILAAKQAAGMYPEADVRVLESTTIGQGYTALSMLCTDSGDTDAIVAELSDCMKSTVTAMISQSVRDAGEVKAGEYIGFVNKDILVHEESPFAAACKLAERLCLERVDVCILLRGKAVETEQGERLEKELRARFPRLELYMLDGRQDIYDYIFILE